MSSAISVVSCVNDFQKYESCVKDSFREEETTGTVELIAIDNASNGLSAPAALNKGLHQATGVIIVFCHQDVVFPKGWTESLLAQISIIEKKCKNWGVLGTFGVAPNGMFAGHIIDPSGHFYCQPLPTEVQSLDEHCLIFKKDSGLRFDEDLGGFHLYGADICIQALARGLANFAIDACVRHLSSGKTGDDFQNAAEKLFDKWKKKKPSLPVIQTTCKMCRLRGGIRGLIGFRIARFKKKRRRKKVQELLRAGAEYTMLRHDSF